MRLKDYGHETWVWTPAYTTTNGNLETRLATIPNAILTITEILELYPTASSVTYVHHGAKFTLKCGQ